jgi:hypothetical protein
MAESSGEIIRRLRHQARSAERKAEHLLDSAAQLFDQKLHDLAVMEAQSLLAEAKALRQQANAIEQAPRNGG